MSKFLRSLLPSILTGAVIGFIVLGIGGRLMMRIIAHWEGRVPGFSLSGSLEVLMMGTIAGIIAGALHGVLRRFVTNDVLRIAVFIVLCIAFTLFGVKNILLRPKILFVAITVIYCVMLELVSQRNKHADPTEVVPPLTA